jgi:predicted extracellular nuclease
LETEPARLEAAALLKGKTDSLFVLRENAHIIIMGDFNDYPDNKSLSRILCAGSIQQPLQKDRLYNLFHHRKNESDFGSYKYQGKWDILDQFIVSGNILMKEAGIQVKNNEAHVFNADFLLENDEKYYGKKPYRTSLGPRYIGGFSDHLPIYMDLTLILEHR